jgi:cold shock CspA family protein
MKIASMQTGIIRFFISEKKYGYVRRDDSLEEYYIPGRNLGHLNLKKGDHIRFKIEKRSNQLIATQIEVIQSKKD